VIKALRDQRLWPWMLIVAGGVLRAWQLTTPMLWYDESFTMLVASRPLADLLTATAADVHPPLYYLIIWSLLRVSEGLNQVLVLRGFSWLCGVLALVIFWLLTGKLSLTHQVRLVALALLAASPVAIFYSQEGRMYAWLMLLVLSALYALFDRNWLGLANMGMLLVYTHNYGLFYWAMIGAMALLREILTTTAHPNTNPDYAYHGTGSLPQSQFTALLAALVVPVVLWLPWLGVLAGQMGMISQGYWIQPVTIGRLVIAMQRGWLAVNLPMPLQLVAILSLTAGLALALVGGLRNRRLVLLWWVLAPLAMAVAISLIWRPVLLYRGLIGSLPAMAILVADVAVNAKNAGRLGRWLLLAPLAIALAWQLMPIAPHTDRGGALWAEPPAGTVYHLEDTSLVVYSANYPDRQHVLIVAQGCPEQTAALTWTTRNALGIANMPLEHVPANGTLAAVVGPLASQCHQQAFDELTQSAVALSRVDSAFGVYGLWERYGH
jgi:uncharacterized membrane protein